MRQPTRGIAVATALAALLALHGCGDASREGTVTLTIPPGASFGEVSDTLEARGLVDVPELFGLYARFRGDDRNVKAGRYELPAGASWGGILDALSQGRVATEPMTVPEGFRLPQIAPRIAELTGASTDSVRDLLERPGADTLLGVPGPGLEGYLFPDTYRFASGVSTEHVVEVMVQRYRDWWTEARRARLDSLGLTERQLVTLASIVQAEARQVEEMPGIASVYHNRLDRGWLLQADPTVQYALGGMPRERLLYAAIDSVQDHPYNTYTQPGLPPGPIGAPGGAALEAALWPAEEEFMFFVARPDGSHVFTRTLAEHNRAKAQSRRAWDSIGRNGEGGS